MLLKYLFIPSCTAQKNIVPRFEFGFGLSYTKFKYSGLSVEKVASTGPESKDAGHILAWENGGAMPIEVGTSRAFWLHRPAYKVCFWLQNTGSVFGSEVKLDFPSHFFVFYLTIDHQDPTTLYKFSTFLWRAPLCSPWVHEHENWCR